MVKKHVGRSERGVSAKVHLGRGRHPAQIEVFAVRDDKSGLGQIVFRRDRLQAHVFEPFREEANAGRVARERSLGESSDFEIGNFHRRAIALNLDS